MRRPVRDEMTRDLWPVPGDRRESVTGRRLALVALDGDWRTADASRLSRSARAPPE